jgi:hypothetical protein
VNIEKHLKYLAERARGERVSGADVSDRVVRLLCTDPVQPVYTLERPLIWMAGLSSVLAVSAVLAALVFYFGGSVDPLNEMMETVSWASLQ